MMKLARFPMDQAAIMLDRIAAIEPEVFASWQNKQRWEIVHHHLNTNSFYKAQLKKKAANWEDLPVLTKQHFQISLPAFLSTDAASLRHLYIGSTSGSSGHPFFFAKDKLAHALTWVQISRLYASYGITSRSKQARFYGIPLGGKGYYIEKIKDWIANRERFSVFDLSDVTFERWINKFKEKRFDYLYGYTSALVYFARYCIANHIVLKDHCRTLRLCIVTSEVCTVEDRAILEAGFGVSVVNEYGASEVGIIAFEHADHTWRICDELLYIETVDEDGQPVPDGCPGQILITSLFNLAMPLIRYQIGDIGIIRRLSGGVTILERLEGRVNDFVLLPSGKVAPGLTFYYISRSLLEYSGFISEFIIRQTALDTLVFVIVASRTITDKEKAMIQDKMDLYLEPGLKLIIEQVDRIERVGSGKIKHFYSQLAKIE